MNEFEYLRQVAVALSPDLAENEMRIVLSWETTQDLDLYALQMDKYFLNWIMILYIDFLYVWTTKITKVMKQIPLFWK